MAGEQDRENELEKTEEVVTEGTEKQEGRTVSRREFLSAAGTVVGLGILSRFTMIGAARGGERGMDQVTGEEMGIQATCSGAFNP